jgi:hypothetical protein
VNGFWAVVAWLIPFVNLWIPRQFVLDIDRATTGTSESGRNSVLGELIGTSCWEVARSGAAGATPVMALAAP